MTLREWLCSAPSNVVMRVGRLGYQWEMQFIYTSSHRGKGEYTVSNLYRMEYICKNKNLQNKGQGFVSLHFPNDPSMR